MDNAGIRQAQMTIETYRQLHKGENPKSDMVTSYFLDNVFYELRYYSQNRQWRLTEYKKTEEVVINDT